MKHDTRSIPHAATPLLCAIVIGWFAAASLTGCAGSRGGAVLEQGGGESFSAEEIGGKLAAIGGATVARRGDGVEVTFDSEALFGSDSAMLLLESERTVEELAGVLVRYPAARIAVSAHTDSIGPDDYKTTMTERQAFSIGEILIDMGVPPSRIETRGFGDLHPAAPNATPEGRRANRRVTIDIIPETAAGKR